MLCTTLTCHPPSPSTVYALLWPLITRAHAGFSIGSLPPSAHRMDFTHLMSSYSLFCFLFIVQCVPFCLIYQALFKPCSRGRIINFLFNFCRCHCCCIWAVDERLINFPQTSVRWRSVLKTGKQSSGRLKTKGRTCHFRCQLELARAFFFFPLTYSILWHFLCSECISLWLQVLLPLLLSLTFLPCEQLSLSQWRSRCPERLGTASKVLSFQDMSLWSPLKTDSKAPSSSMAGLEGEASCPVPTLPYLQAPAFPRLCCIQQSPTLLFSSAFQVGFPLWRRMVGPGEITASTHVLLLGADAVQREKRRAGRAAAFSGAGLK